MLYELHIWQRSHFFLAGGGGGEEGVVETSSSKHACSVPARPSSL